ncbi:MULTISPECIES: DMT family transporter [Hyphobacterium]|uniref:DMT family transporter n=1 Tax=Hyphobacterium vulgare TaxID=1736751 RepID=A0ABV6ZZ34_9PROT
MSPLRAAGPKEWALLGVLAATWGTAFAFISFALDAAPPGALAFARLALAAIMLTVWAYAIGEKLPGFKDKRWLWFIALGLFGNALPFTLIPWGQQFIPSAVAGILLAFMPLMTVAMAHVFTDEKMTKITTLGFGVGFAGVVVLIGPAALGGLVAGDFVAQLAVLGAALSFAMNVVIARRAPPMHPLVSAAGMLVLAAVWTAPYGLLDLIHHARPNAAGWAAALWLAIGPTALGSVIYMRLVTTAGAGFLSTTNYIVPVVALGAGLVLGEAIGLSAPLGLVIILVGIVIARRGQRAASRSGQT